MNCWFLLKCYFIGMLAASGIGPIFVLTFNRGAIHGFLRGFATAFGAALGDSLYFFLALMGVLAVFEGSKSGIIILDIIGGAILMFLGYRLFHKKPDSLELTVGKKESVFITISRSFVLTVVNPLTVFFFMLVVVKILPDGTGDFALPLMVLCSVMVTLGSLTVLTTVSLVASLVGHLISDRALYYIQLMTSGVFFMVGFYLFCQFILIVLRG